MNEKKKPNAKELIEDIKVLESAEEIDALLPKGEERTTVLDAAKARKAELAESAQEPEEEAQTSEEEGAEDDAQEDITEETKVEIGEDRLLVLESAIAEVLETERALRPSNGKPTSTEAELVEAASIFDDVENVTVEKVKALDKAITEHLQYDEQRRGLSQPNKAIKGLINSYEKYRELELEE